MKLLFASDSFKGSLSSADTVRLLTRAAEEVFGPCETQGVPVADGGEGTVDAVIGAVQGTKVFLPVHGPLGDEVQAFYGIFEGSKAVIEMAQASGLPLVPEDRRDPLYTTTLGTGELIRDALHRGCTDVSIAIGGSATNDGGIGCLRALGVKFYDADGAELMGYGKDLAKIARIDTSGLEPLVQEAKITVMCDVSNPLCGPEGATYTFGKQKGATPEIQVQLEAGMCHYRDLLIEQFGIDCDQIPGAGAAGGLGAALKVFLRGEMRSGIETVLDLVHFNEQLTGVDLVVTGEGRTDWQTCYGKVMQGVGQRAKTQGIPVLGLCGSLGPGAMDICAHGVASLMTTVNAPMPLSEAIERAEELYYDAAVRMFRFVKAGMELQTKSRP